MTAGRYPAYGVRNGKMRIKSVFAVTLVFLSCSFSPPAERTVQPPAAGEAGLLAEVRRFASEGEDKETWKAGKQYLDTHSAGEEVPEVRLYLGEAGLNLGYLTDARELLLPLADDGVDPSIRKPALTLLFRREKE